METMDDITVTEATAEDKDDVLLINNNVFGGLDYLEDYFDDFIRSPVTTLYKALYKDQIVGFIATTLVDDGNTVVTRAARVKPQLAGKGVFKMLRQHSLKMSAADINAFIASNALEYRTKSSFQKENMHIMSRALRRYDFDISQLSLSDQLINIHSSEPLSRSTLQWFITSDRHREYLFPEGRIVVDWVPFKLVPSNIELFWIRGDRSLRLTDVQHAVGEMKGLLSISTIYRSSNGTYVCTIDIYGTDSTSLPQHAMRHLIFLRKRAVMHVSVWVITDSRLKTSAVETTFKGAFNLEKTDWKFNADSDALYTEQCLYEKTLLEGDA